ncbi:SUF system Fe-S cluster assembly protein [Paraburkholderia sp. SOS3]|jgi:FeS assembly SUF system protein|uniref:SUF system Fe-S cluster assembly protein n=1 Tax=Paraburkholderia sp. SOS3 TaxID=1926494 RepID=UPI0009475840|nr:SUF system Fe-S cluster assembly protein [Paraburkholderia sp. SOS3]APR39572.1 SUF system Fe-S cluster assembly protein [Paraburkholderia sp. SOS3]
MSGESFSGESARALEDRVIEGLRTLYDPEIPVNIYDLGLIYDLKVDEKEGRVEIQMTLTAPACPVAETFPSVVEEEVFSLAGVRDVRIDLVWDPPWTKARMTEAARLQLGMF